MDARHFDALSRDFAAPGPRRRVLGMLAGLPVLGGLVGLLTAENSAAKERRRRRKQRHKRRKHHGTRKKGCKPQGKGKLCAGTCGPVTSRQTCGKTVDCGSCDCPTPCGACFICQGGPNTPGACVRDPEQVGDPCGSAGQVCQGDGSCACGAGTCANPTPLCASGVCEACADDDACVAASAGDICCAGSCFDGVCCGSGECLTEQAPDCVAHHCACAANGDAACASDEVCCGDGCADLDTNPDHCGDCETTCTSPTPTCEAGGCVGCSVDKPCGAGLCCRGDGTCVAACPACQACSSGQCVADTSLDHACGGPCASGEWCAAGACVSMDETVTIQECHSLCGGSTEICGQTVMCPACSLATCYSATGCSSINNVEDGPAGTGSYCSIQSGTPCSTNADCAASAPFSYCTGSPTLRRCTQICGI